MAPTVQAAGRRLLVWLFATLAGLQTLTSCIIATYHKTVFDAAAWFATTVLVVVLASSLENVKQFLEESFQ